MKKKMNAGVIALIVVLILLACSAGAYCFYANSQYKTRFIQGTNINGIDVSGLTAEEVEEIVRNKVESYTLKLTFRDGAEEVLSGSDFGFVYQSDNGVAKLLEQQNIYEWGLGKLGQKMSFTVGEAYTYDADLLEQLMNGLPEFDKANVIQPVGAHMAIGTDHMMTIVPEVDGNALRASVVLKALKKAVDSGKTEVNIGTLKNAYKTAKTRSDDTALNAQVNDLNTYLGLTVTYTMYDGTQAVVDNTLVSEWLSVKDDDNDFYYLNTDVLKAKCEEYVKSLADQYDKVTDSVTFHSTNRGDIVIPTEKRGYQISRADEAEALYQAILSRQSSVREPVYLLNNGFMSEVGNTYIEIDKKYQHVYYYIDGSLYIDTPCVTGLEYDSERATPTGIFSIYEKDTDRTLRGINYETGETTYESFVNYWMRFNGGIGLHDASWRSSFGGDIYLYDGSHGCINLPYSAAEAIYYSCSNGTTVLVI